MATFKFTAYIIIKIYLTVKTNFRITKNNIINNYLAFENLAALKS